MTKIGDNSPPPDAAFSLHIDSLFSLLSDTLAGGDVSTDEQEAAIDDLLDEFRKAATDAEKERKTEKEPHLEAGRQVDQKWKPITDKAKRGADACKDALSPYRIAKQAAKDEAARKAREEAERLQREAQEALQTSDDLEARFHAEQELEAAKRLSAQANRIDRSATGLRTYWEAEIVDKGMALRHYLKTNPDAFLELIQRLADKDAQNEATRRSGIGIAFHERKRAA